MLRPWPEANHIPSSVLDILVWKMQSFFHPQQSMILSMRAQVSEETHLAGVKWRC